MHKLTTVLTLFVLSFSSAMARGPASTISYGSGGADGLLLLLLLGAFFWFITSKFGMTILVFSILFLSVGSPLVLIWLMADKASVIELIAYGSLMVSVYWGPLLASMLPDTEEYAQLRNFGGCMATMALIGLLPAAFVGGVFALIFDGEQARAIGILATLIFIYYWASKKSENDAEK